VAYCTAIGAPSLAWRQPAIDRTIAGLRDNLDVGTYDAVCSAGSALSIDRAVAEILDTQL
jgi:hypothetical protein